MPKFDLAKTQRIDALCRVAREQRDQRWVDEFFANVVEASMAARDPQVHSGPDGFPYFGLYLPPSGQPFETFCVSHILENCTDGGVGIDINPAQPQPDWVFSYGVLWSLRAYGTFTGDGLDTPRAGGPGRETEVVAKARQVLTGSPSEVLLPGFARTVLRRVLGRHGVREPRVALVVDQAARPTRNLVFNLEPGQVGGREAFEGVMTRLTWFLPPGLGLMAPVPGVVEARDPL
jgi:hypothetical protein